MIDEGKVLRYALKVPDGVRGSVSVGSLGEQELVWSIESTGNNRWTAPQRKQLIRNLIEALVPEDIEFVISHIKTGNERFDVELGELAPEPLKSRAALLQAASGLGAFRAFAISGAVESVGSLHKDARAGHLFLGEPDLESFDTYLKKYLDRAGRYDLLCTMVVGVEGGFTVEEMTEMAKEATPDKPTRESWRCSLGSVAQDTRVFLLRQGENGGIVGFGRTDSPVYEEEGKKVVDVLWTHASLSPFPGLDRESLDVFDQDTRWAARQSGIRLPSWVGDRIEARIKGSILDAVVEAFDALGTPHNLIGKAKHYRQIRMPGWPTNAHYELLEKNGQCRVEIHLEGHKGAADVRHLVSPLRNLAKRLNGQLGEKVSFYSRWYKRGRLVVHHKEGCSPRQIAQLMSDLIRKTHEELTKAMTSDPWPDDVEQMVAFLQHKPQMILYGPPGTGKTRLARRAACMLLGCARHELDEPDRFLSRPDFRLVVFHPAYGYDQFIGGLRVSVENGMPVYTQEPGIFTHLCEAASQSKEPHILVIDEINRGNLPRLLGELLYGLEYRDSEVVFSFDGKKRKVPKNLYVIGTMNTADRSVGTLDAAVRRRFAFNRIGPDPTLVKVPRLRRLLEMLNDKLKELASMVPELADLQVGHSYFLECDETGFDLRWQLEVRPLLEEYGRFTGHPEIQTLLVKDWRALVGGPHADAG